MTPIQAVEYMRTTSKAVRAERTPPWITNTDWINLHYVLVQDQIVTTWEGNHIQTQPLENWLNWWYNFCYNNSTNATNLLPV